MPENDSHSIAVNDLIAPEAKKIIRKQIQLIGDDPDREGLIETPSRVFKSWSEIFSGYNTDPSNLLKSFTEGACDEMVILRDIEFYSMCEHHMLPFYGSADIGYIPDGRIVGLSKLARMVEVYARRLQVQERLTAQIADAIGEALNPKGVMVVVRAKHLCMMARGIRKRESQMVTSAIRGVFRDRDEARQEFLELTR